MVLPLGSSASTFQCNYALKSVTLANIVKLSSLSNVKYVILTQKLETVRRFFFYYINRADLKWKMKDVATVAAIENFFK